MRLPPHDYVAETADARLRLEDKKEPRREGGARRGLLHGSGG
jgi:hypothetical protein